MSYNESQVEKSFSTDALTSTVPSANGHVNGNSPPNGHNGNALPVVPVGHDQFTPSVSFDGIPTKSGVMQWAENHSAQINAMESTDVALLHDQIQRTTKVSSPDICGILGHHNSEWVAEFKNDQHRQSIIDRIAKLYPPKNVAPVAATVAATVAAPTINPSVEWPQVTIEQVRKMNLAQRAALILHQITPMLTPGAVFEMRVNGMKNAPKRVDSGYYDNAEDFSKDAARYEDKANVYITLNPALSKMLDRSPNQVIERAELTTGNDQIERRCWLPIDCDPIRITGISSTDQQVAEATERAYRIRDWLRKMGWPAPVMALSGNGIHLNYPVDLPNDKETDDLIKHCLQALQLMFGDPLKDDQGKATNQGVKVDCSVFNPARIWKVYGTIAKKGPDTKERPHRLAQILSAPAELQIVSLTQLRTLAQPIASAAQKTTSTQATSKGGLKPLDIVAWLEKHNIAYTTKPLGDNRTKYMLTVCPYDSSHTDNSAWIITNAEGALAAECWHDSCTWKWADLRAKFDAPKPDRNSDTTKTIDKATGEIIETPAPVPTMTLEEIVDKLKGIAANKTLDKLAKGVAAYGLIGDIFLLPDSTYPTIIATLQSTGIFKKNAADAFERKINAKVKERKKEAVDSERKRKTTEKLARRKEKIEKLRAGKPSIVVNNRGLEAIAEDAMAVVFDYNNHNPHTPAFYLRTGNLVRVGNGGKGKSNISKLETAALRGMLARLAHWVTETEGPEGMPIEKLVSPPIDVCEDILSYSQMGEESDKGSFPGVPELLALTTCPTFSKEGILHNHPGYNPATKLYYTGYVPVDFNKDATREEAVQAWNYLNYELFGDFIFKSQAGRANMLALTLLPSVKPMVGNVTPFHLIRGHIVGTGKSKLVNTVAIITTGEKIAGSTSPGADDDEWRKMILAELLKGKPFVFIDNINNGEIFGGDAIASALTSGKFSGRELGASRMIEIDTAAVWVGTGNNVVLKEDVVRRTVLIDLDTNMEQPEKRTGFRHPKLEQWAIDNRPKLLAAVLTIVQAWVNAGMPEYSGDLIGSYEEWTSIIGGIIEFVGVPGFMANQDEIKAASSTDGEMWREFLIEWAKTYPLDKVNAKTRSPLCVSNVPTSDLFFLASHEDPGPDGKYQHPQDKFKDLLEPIFKRKGQENRLIDLGKALGQKNGVIFGDYRIVKGKTKKSKLHWELHKVDPNGFEKPQQAGFDTLGGWGRTIFGPTPPPTPPPDPHLSESKGWGGGVEKSLCMPVDNEKIIYFENGECDQDQHKKIISDHITYSVGADNPTTPPPDTLIGEKLGGGVGGGVVPAGWGTPPPHDPKAVANALNGYIDDGYEVSFSEREAYYASLADSMG